MGWEDSDTKRLKHKVAKLKDGHQPLVSPKQLATALKESGTACLLGEAGCERYLGRLVDEAAKNNPAEFVPFKVRQDSNRYEQALSEAGVISLRRNKIMFTREGITFIWNACHTPTFA